MSLAGCASMVNITPSAGNAQRLTYDSGEPRLTSVKAFTVVLQVKSTLLRSGKPAEFVVAVFNPTAAPVEVSTDNVTASWNGAPLKVYSFDELMADEQRRQSTKRLGLALQAFGAGLQGGQQTQPVQGTIVGPSGITTYSGTATYSDPGSAILAQQSVDANIQSFKVESAATIRQLERTIFRRHTVATNTAYAGIVRIMVPSEIREAERIFVSVTIQHEAHLFALDLNPIKDQ